MKDGLVRQLNFDHKIWGVVSVMMERRSGLSNMILGCFTCYEGLLRQTSDSLFLYATNQQVFSVAIKVIVTNES
jgi:hypothetical protein